MDTALDKLERIHELWKELGRTKLNTKEYEALMQKIRLLSAEYQKLIDCPQNPGTQNESLTEVWVREKSGTWRSPLSF